MAPRSVAAASLVLLLLVLLTFGTQLISFKVEVIDWDESTFMLMAQDLLRGHLPYVALFDNKPPLLFFTVAGVFALFGQSLEAARWFGDACIFVTAAMVFGMLRGRAGTVVAGLVAAALVAAHVADYGFHTSSEIVANVPLTAALWVLLDRGDRAWAGLAAGFLMSLAVLTRSNLVIVVCAVGLLYLLALWRPTVVGLARRGMVGFVIGGLVPLSAVLGLYAANGALPDLILATVGVPLSYASGQAGPFGVIQQMVLSFGAGGLDPAWTVRALGLLLALALVILELPKRVKPAARELGLVGLWLLAILLSIMLGGIFYEHYLLQLYPPVAVLIGLAASRGRLAGVAVAAGAVVVTGLGVWWSAPGSFAVMHDWNSLRAAWPVHAAAAAIAADRQPGDAIWPLSDHLVLFYLDEPPPSAAGLHPGNLIRPEIMTPLIKAGYAPADEFGRLMATRPRYLVTDNDGAVVWLPAGADLDRFTAWEKANYAPWFAKGDVAVWKRND